MTVESNPDPHLVNFATLLLAPKLDVWLGTLPAAGELVADGRPPVPPSWAGTPGVIFEFPAPGLPDPVCVFVPAAAFPPGTGAEFHEMLDKIHDPAGEAQRLAAVARAHDANLLSGRLAASPVIHCPGCGARLFGEVARRGACLACYPDLPPGDAQAVEVAP